jgi:ERCC4-type nuclease
MEVNLIITPTETQLIEECKNQNIQYIEKPLLIGDIHIEKNGKVEYIIERKSKGDLYASITSGRYNDQKQRMRDSGIETYRIVYLVENLLYRKQQEKIIWSAITNTLYRDRMTVFQTKNIHESVKFLKSLLHTIQKETVGSRDAETATVNITQKKKHVTHDNWFSHSLTLIPRVSPIIATKILELYPSYDLLKSAYQLHGKDCLSDITIHSKRIGKLSQQIGECLFGHELSKL